ncbi:hypothetical protein DH2020_040081 [Rehmannia glutinosa]|uniref:Uncharacterized protein n=1 Tax=Rehmannia glutinosa TaxID=99300 RepID=A0ABR0UU34_REHGL
MEECQKIDLEFEAHGLIDDNQFSGALSTEKEVDISLGINPTDHLPQLHESMEPERNQKNGRYNLRKSLAWDSAFFTSAGVLDAEELSTMITGADKREKHLLPGIQEDITGSTESISSLGSDTLTLETLGDDLFVDIRASIQRSTLKKEDVVSENKIPKPGLKKTSSLQTVRMSKCQPKQNIGKLGSGKQASRIMSIHQCLWLRLQRQIQYIVNHPRLTAAPSPLQQHQESGILSELVVPNLNVESQNLVPLVNFSNLHFSIIKSYFKTVSDAILNLTATVSSKGTQPPKVSSLNGPRRALPKPALSSKCSLSGSSTISRANSTRSSTLSDSSSNMSTGTSIKPTLMTARRNPAYLMSAKISSSVSPASSISEWSMDGDSIPLDQRNKSDDRAAEGHGNQGVSLTSNNSKNPQRKLTKSSARTPNGHQQSPSTVQNGIPKNGAAIGTPIQAQTANRRALSAPKETCQEVEQVVAIIEKSLGDLKINTNPVEGTNALGSEYIGEVLTGDNKNTYQNVCGSINELLSDTTAFESGACRAPLALKNSFCSDKCTDMPKELDIQVADKTGFVLPSSEQKEN